MLSDLSLNLPCIHVFISTILMIYNCCMLYTTGERYERACSMSDDEVASSEVAEGDCPFHEGNHVDRCVVSMLQAGKDSLGQYAMKFNYTAFYGYIRDLLIRTNSMVHICYVKYGGNAEIFVLAVRDDELSLGDNKDTSSEDAEGQGTRGTPRVTWMGVALRARASNMASRVRVPSSWGWHVP